MDTQSLALSPKACRSARDLLRLSQAELASAAGISVSTLRRFESGEVKVSRFAMGRIEDALQRHGIVFVGASEPKLR